MKKITPCLFFNGDFSEAFRFYKSIFKHKAKLVEAHKRDGKVLFGSIHLFGQDFMFINDGRMKYKFTPAFSLFLSCANQKEVDYYWSRLSKGGEEVACGWLTDKYGLSWQVIPVQLMQLMENKDRKKAGRAFQAMIKMVKIDVATLQRAAKGTE